MSHDVPVGDEVAPADCVLRYVHSIHDHNTIRLDLHQTGGTFALLRESFDISPPRLRKAYADGFVNDGNPLVASAYENRRLRFTLRLNAGSSPDALGGALAVLGRELDRETNWLQWQPRTTEPVFWRTFRSTYSLRRTPAAGHVWLVDLDIEAEPFAYGERQFDTLATVTNNPAGGQVIDITGVLGDVPTPALIAYEGDTSNEALYVGLKVGESFDDFDHAVQLEAFTLGTDATLPGNDATMSGSGSNYVRVSFATPTDAIRVKGDIPGTAAESVEYEGEYRMLLRYRGATATGTFTITPKVGQRAAPDAELRALDSVTVTTTSTTSRKWLDLGRLRIPNSNYSGFGYGGETPPVEQVRLALSIARSSVSGGLDLDCLVLMPADRQMLVLGPWAADGTDNGIYLDGPNDQVWRHTNTLAVSSRTAPARAGLVPELVPGEDVINRLVFIRYLLGGNGDDITETTGVAVAYWPRWLVMRS